MPNRERLYAIGGLGLALALTSEARADPDDPNGDPPDDGNGGTDPSTFAVIAESNGEVDYTAEFDAEYVNPAGSGDLAAENNDDITNNGDGTYTVSGFTGNAGFGDTFEYLGTLTSFSAPGATAAYRLEIDGEDVTDDYATPPGGRDDLGPVGGGQGYADAVYQYDAEYVAGSRTELDNALSQASEGEVVFLATDLPRDGAGDGIRVPRGVTLASGRGTSDHTATVKPRGGKDWDTYNGMSAFVLERNARVTGVRVEGHETRYRRHHSRGGVMIWGRGIETVGPNARIDNCEVFGNERGIQCNHPAVVEYCDVHHHLQGGLGYGVRAQARGVQIRHNTFDYNRHSVASSNDSNDYHCHDNWFGPNHVGHVIDHHDGGRDTHIHHNKVEAVNRPTSLPSINDMDIRNAGGRVSSVTFRGVPKGDASVHHNWFYNPDGPIGVEDCGIGTGSSWHCPAVNQVNSGNDGDEYISPSDTQYRSLDVSNNHYGSDTPSDSNVGIRT